MLSWLNRRINQTTPKFIPRPGFFTVELQRRAEEGFTYQGKYAYWGKNFNPRSGFLYTNNIHEGKGSIKYGWFPGEQSPIFKYTIGTDIMMNKRVDDKKIESMRISPMFNMDLKSGYGMFVSFGYNREGVLFDFPLSEDIIIKSGDYSFWALRSQFMTPKTSKVSANLGINAGGFYDGEQISFNFGADFNLSSSLQLTAFYNFDDVKFTDTNLRFTNNLARLKATYMLNTKLTMSAIIQYNELENITISNFRLRYNPRDGNDFYLVFNDLRYADKSYLTPEPPNYLTQTVL